MDKKYIFLYYISCDGELDRKGRNSEVAFLIENRVVALRYPSHSSNAR